MGYIGTDVCRMRMLLDIAYIIRNNMYVYNDLPKTLLPHVYTALPPSPAEDARQTRRCLSHVVTTPRYSNNNLSMSLFHSVVFTLFYLSPRFLIAIVYSRVYVKINSTKKLIKK